jgi:hypothetical protein
MLVLATPPQPAHGRGGPAASRGTSRAAMPPEDRPLEPTEPEDAAESALPVARRAPAPEDQALAQQAQAFDTTVRLRSEAEREMNALREMSMEQVKRDDELLKKWIALI